MTQTPITPGLVHRITQAARYVVSGARPGDWFGPMKPLAPVAPPDVAGRRFDYPTGYNLNTAPRSAEPVSFEELRALADSCDILRSVIETRKDQVEAQEWTVRVAPGHGNAARPTEDQKRRMDAVRAFLESPDREHGFDQWLRLMLEDMFVIDGVAVYKRRNRAGGLYALEIIDAATIKLLLDDSGRLPPAPEPAYQQILKGVPAADFTREELLYLVHNPRSHKVYGYSHVEQVLVTVNILIRRALHQLDYYREGSTPDALIGLPSEWTSDQITAFQKHFDAMLAGNLGQRRRVRFMPGQFKYQETKAPPLKDAYDEYLARVICFVFSISPEPFVGQVNRATAQTSQARATDEGLLPLLRHVKNFLNRIIATEFGSPDLEFAWSEGRAQDPEEAARVDVAYVNAGILTVDEVRANLGLAPIGNASFRGKPESEARVEKLQSARKFNPYHRGPGRGGGQFTTADGDNGSESLINQTFGDVENLSQEAVQAAITAALDRQSRLPTGTQVAADAGTQADGPQDILSQFRNMGTSLYVPILPEGVLGEGAAGAAEAEGTASGEATAGRAAVKENVEWTLGKYKSETRWENQMREREWTPEQITETIKNGEQFKAPNYINKANSATRYLDTQTGRFVVRDDITKEIIQISGEKFEPSILP